MIINPYIYSVGTAYDPDAQLFITATGITGTNATATNQLVVDLKSANIWTKMKAVYPMVGGTATTCKFNLKNPVDSNAAYRLTFGGGGTFSANGYLPNGTNSFADTFLTTSAMALNSGHLSYYSRTNSTILGEEMGALQNSPNSYTDLVINYSGFGATFRYNDGSGATGTANANTQGFYVGSRTASNLIKLFKNGLSIQSLTSASNTTSSTRTIFIGAINNSGTPSFYSNRECAFASIGDGLTDLESQLFYQITEKYQVALGRNINPTQTFYYNTAYNNETNAFLFSTQITDATIQTATDTLVTDLKTAGIYTKMKALYPMVGGTATTHKYNLINPQDSNAAFRLAFSGGGTHSANGYLPNGTNAYADTFLIPSAFYSTNMHLSYYSRTSAIGTVLEIGCSQVISGGTTYSSLATARNSIFGFTTNGLINYLSQPNSLGFFLGQKLTNSSRKVFRNGVVNNLTVTTDANNLPNTNTYIGAINDNGTPAFYSSKQCAFASIGDGLTDAEALAYYNAVNAFQVSLGRNV